MTDSRPPQGHSGQPEQPRQPGQPDLLTRYHQHLNADPVLRTVSRAAFALVMLFALLLFWRGHNAPGGGFIGGLTVVAALVLHRIAYGSPALRIPPRLMVAPGLLLALGTGLATYVAGQPFLKSYFGYIYPPVIGEFEWTTALAFDLGVLLVVVGGVMSIIDDLIEVPAPGAEPPPGEEGRGR